MRCAALLFAVLTACSSAQHDERCQVPPLGSVVVHTEGTRNFEGRARVVRFDPPWLVLPDASFRLEGPLPDLETGREYEWVVTVLPGWPTATSLRISDERGLLYAVVEDWDVGRNVPSVPGFDVALVDAGCPPRRDSCHPDLRNRRLRVSHAGEQLALFHGEEGTLGEYRVRARTALRPSGGSSLCVDAGFNAVAYVIERAATSSRPSS